MEYTKMHFTEYLKHNQSIFTKKKEIYSQDRRTSGAILEDLVFDLFTKYGYRIERHKPEVDYLFGADMKLSWTNGDQHYSIHLDLTINPKKNYTRWLDYMGEDSFNDSCFFGGNLFRACYGLKKKHPTGFTYTAPVYVMRVENQWIHDLNAYQQEFFFAIENLKRIHMESDRPRRASMMMNVPNYLLGGNPQ